MLFEERCLDNILQQRRIRLHGTQEEELAAISDRLVELQLFDGFYESQTHHVYYMFKRRGNDRFYVVSMWKTRSAFRENGLLKKDVISNDKCKISQKYKAIFFIYI